MRVRNACAYAREVGERSMRIEAVPEGAVEGMEVRMLARVARAV